MPVVSHAAIHRFQSVNVYLKLYRRGEPKLQLLSRDGLLLAFYLLYLYLFRKHENTITYNGQDSETTMVLNTALNNLHKNDNETIASDHMTSGQIGHERKTRLQLSMPNSNN